MPDELTSIGRAKSVLNYTTSLTNSVYGQANNATAIYGAAAALFGETSGYFSRFYGLSQNCLIRMKSTSNDPEKYFISSDGNKYAALLTSAYGYSQLVNSNFINYVLFVFRKAAKTFDNHKEIPLSVLFNSSYMLEFEKARLSTNSFVTRTGRFIMSVNQGTNPKSVTKAGMIESCASYLTHIQGLHKPITVQGTRRVPSQEAIDDSSDKVNRFINALKK